MSKMEIKFTKKDFWLTILGGEATAWLSLPILKNLKIFNFLSQKNINLTGFLIFWILFVPTAAISTLSIFYFFAKYKNRIGFWELGKYGVIGVLNTFLNAGIYNFLIFATDVSAGFAIDLFFIAAFIITVVNSFFWNKYWSFEKGETELAAGEALKFFGVSIIVAVINTGILDLIVNKIGAPVGLDPKAWANIALALTIITAFFGNFFGYKFIVFKNRN